MTTKRGRPRSSANTRLVQALISKQDAMSRRTARRIQEVLDTHVSAEAVRIVWSSICSRVQAVLGAVPDRAAARIAATSNPREVRALLHEEIRAALHQLASKETPLSELPPEETAPKVTRSHSLAEARGQLARIQTRLMDMKARIARVGEVAATAADGEGSTKKSGEE